MYYLIHLAIPGGAAALMAGLGLRDVALGWSNLDALVDVLLRDYMILAAPHWVWAAVSAYFDAEKGTTVGGFLGAHLLLFSVSILVLQTKSPGAANGWFLYLLGAPIAIGVGAVVGRWMALLKVAKGH